MGGCSPLFPFWRPPVSFPSVRDALQRNWTKTAEIIVGILKKLAKIFRSAAVIPTIYD